VKGVGARVSFSKRGDAQEPTIKKSRKRPVQKIIPRKVGVGKSRKKKKKVKGRTKARRKKNESPQKRGREKSKKGNEEKHNKTRIRPALKGTIAPVSRALGGRKRLPGPKNKRKRVGGQPLNICRGKWGVPDQKFTGEFEGSERELKARHSKTKKERKSHPEAIREPGRVGGKKTKDR